MAFFPELLNIIIYIKTIEISPPLTHICHSEFFKLIMYSYLYVLYFIYRKFVQIF